jgi:eukaryotic-like serine/threonine-protein kinase
MTPERWQKVKEIFQAALDRAPGEWSAFLASACGGDVCLRQEVESLLASHEKDGSFIDSPAYEAAAGLFPNDQGLGAGQTLGHYEILSTLGHGGMGEVYLAQDTKLGRKVALKFLPASFTQDANRLRRFEQEARAASALNHPNILTIHEIGEVDSHHFIATEYIDGQTLRERLANRRLKVEETLDTATQIASALAAAHEEGIIHRDIKPDNLMFRRDGIVKVLDFGLAKLMDQKEVGAEDATRQLVKTSAGMVMGTVAYMSPEQARGLAVDARTDIWSLGVVLYEMLTSRPPFEGPTTSDLIVSVLEREPPPLGTDAEIPAELQRIVAKMLRKDREQRYQCVRDLLLDLKRLREEAEFAVKLKRSTAPTATAAATKTQPATRTSSAEYVLGEIRTHKLVAIAAMLVLAVGSAALYYFIRGKVSNTPTGNETIDSLAVLPFVNAAQDPNAEYFSDGITESLINRLSQLSGLKVMSSGSVFRYKGKQQDAQKVGNELTVRAVLTGSVKQVGDQLVINVSLDDAKDNHRIWGEQYVRKFADVLAVQSEIAQEVSTSLRLKLTRGDEQQLAKRYTNNVEAYQLYLKGRYHLLKYTPPEIQTGISYFQQAIEIDPSYTLAYVGLADGYRTFALVGEMPATELLKAKVAAQKAVEIDDTLAEAHAELGFTIFWYDWNWNAAESQLKRALDLNPNNADAHLFYAHLLSNTARHAEGLAEVERARQLDPLDLRINGLEAQFLVHAGKPDEALAFLQKTLEVNPNNWFAHMFASSAYIEKGMFGEAVAEARKARELNGVNSQATAQLGYALAKSGKQTEARGLLKELLKRSTERYVSRGNIALIYNGLGERDETLAWLERGYKERDAKMVFLKVEPKWNNLRADSRFQDLLRRVGF